jgi:hypothetical protein
MRRIEAQLEHGELVADTEKFALKGADRFKLKLAERINLQPGESADALASRIVTGQVLWCGCLCSNPAGPDQDADVGDHFAWAVPQALISIG